MRKRIRVQHKRNVLYIYNLETFTVNILETPDDTENIYPAYKTN